MSIRNKRLIREIPRLDYNLTWDENWQTKDLAVITTVRQNMLISISLTHTYPFHCPLLRVQGTEYISWFLKENMKFKQMKDELNIMTPCICCYSLTCSWTPSLGIKDMIQEFDKHYELYQSLVKFYIIYKLEYFDNLIYQKISQFLY